MSAVGKKKRIARPEGETIEAPVCVVATTAALAAAGTHTVGRFRQTDEQRRCRGGPTNLHTQPYCRRRSSRKPHWKNTQLVSQRKCLSSFFFFLFSLARVWQLSRENRVGCHCSEAALANSSFVFLENERSHSRNSIRISLIFLLRSRGHRFHYRGSVYETSFSPKK